MTAPYELSATAALRELQRGLLLPSELLLSLLDRCEAAEPAVQAWETPPDRERIVATAHALDTTMLAHRRDLGDRTLPADLTGLPLGVKDIFLTKGMRTTAGFPPYAQWIPDEDAAIVRQLLDRGALLFGKTVTTQFAFSDPARTRNPWRPDRTPGGSSSGSAAAVAARMVPLALGTQTAGSVLRPAAYCGVIGFKPTYGLLSTNGVLPLAWSLDHVGVLCRAVADAALVLGVALPMPRQRPVFGLVTDLVDAAAPRVREHLRTQARRFEARGARLVDVRLPLGLDTVLAVHHVTMQTEVTAVHSAQLDAHRDAYAPLLRRYVEVGRLLPGYVYHHAQRLRTRYRRAVAHLFDAYQLDALLTPTAADIAPERATTGDTRFQAIWTLIGIPTISLPSGLSDEGLPFAVQLAGRANEDAALLDVAAWCEQVLGPLPAPPL